MNVNPDSNISVATVCGKEVRVFGSYDGKTRRAFLWSREFLTKGAAQLFATEFDESERKARESRQR